VDHHDDLVLEQTEGPGEVVVVYDRHALDLEEVVSGPQRPDLGQPAILRPLAQAIRVRALEAPSLFGVRQVIGASEPAPDGPRRAVDQDAEELGPRQAWDRALRSHAARDRAKSASMRLRGNDRSAVSLLRASRTPQLMSYRRPGEIAPRPGGGDAADRKPVTPGRPASRATSRRCREARRRST
jgi:hypothetical protein